MDGPWVGDEVRHRRSCHRIRQLGRDVAEPGPLGRPVPRVDERDAAIAATMMKWLNRHYPGHLWGCIADTRQGIVKFNIPILMGMNNWWVVNLRTHDIIDGMRQGAGQILERYRLRRGRFDLTTFLEARDKHSALVIPSRKVPE